MGRTCGEPNEIELTAVGVKLNGSGRVQHAGAATAARGSAQIFSMSSSSLSCAGPALTLSMKRPPAPSAKNASETQGTATYS